MNNIPTLLRRPLLALTFALALALSAGCSKDKPTSKATAGKTTKGKRTKDKKAGAKKDEDKAEDEAKNGDKAEEKDRVEKDDKGEEGEKPANDEGAKKAAVGDAPEEPAKVDEAKESVTEKVEGQPKDPAKADLAAEAKEAVAVPTADEPVVATEGAKDEGQAAPKPKEAAAGPAGALVAHPTDPAAVAAAPAPKPAAPPPTAAPPTAAPPPSAGSGIVSERDRGPPLDITGYLSAADLERVFGKKLKFRRTNLAGVKPHKGYNALYYADAKGKEFGVSVQVWRDRNLVDSRTRYNTMRNTYSDVVETNRVTAQGFRSFYGNVVSLVFADPRRPMLASVSCSIKFCTADSVIELSRRVAGRMR